VFTRAKDAAGRATIHNLFADAIASIARSKEPPFSPRRSYYQATDSTWVPPAERAKLLTFAKSKKSLRAALAEVAAFLSVL